MTSFSGLTGTPLFACALRPFPLLARVTLEPLPPRLVRIPFSTIAKQGREHSPPDSFHSKGHSKRDAHQAVSHTRWSQRPVASEPAPAIPGPPAPTLRLHPNTKTRKKKKKKRQISLQYRLHSHLQEAQRTSRSFPICRHCNSIRLAAMEMVAHGSPRPLFSGCQRMPANGGKRCAKARAVPAVRWGHNAIRCFSRAKGFPSPLQLYTDRH